MAASNLVKDVLFRISSQLQDISPQFVRWTQRELVDWLNDGQKAIAKYMPSSCSRVDAVKLRPGTKQSIEKIAAAGIIPGDGSDSVDVFGASLLGVLRNMGTDGATPGNAIRVTDREIYDLNVPNWHTVIGPVITGFMFDPRIPKVWYSVPAVPTNVVVWVEVAFLANPIEIPAGGSYGMDGSDPTTISISDVFVDDLVNYVLARAFMKDAEYATNRENATFYMGQFTGSLNAQVAALTGVNPNLRSLPNSPTVPKA